MQEKGPEKTLLIIGEDEKGPIDIAIIKRKT